MKTEQQHETRQKKRENKNETKTWRDERAAATKVERERTRQINQNSRNGFHLFLCVCLFVCCIFYFIFFCRLCLSAIFILFSLLSVRTRLHTFNHHRAAHNRPNTILSALVDANRVAVVIIIIVYSKHIIHKLIYTTCVCVAASNRYVGVCKNDGIWERKLQIEIYFVILSFHSIRFCGIWHVIQFRNSIVCHVRTFVNIFR